MRAHACSATLLGIALSLALAGSGCDSGKVFGTNEGGPGGDGGGDGVQFSDSSGPACSNNNDCNGGVCVAGRCCASAAQACGDSCCGASETCFANACVKPGRVCFSKADCDADQYCEPSLGPGGSNGGDAGPAADAAAGDAAAGDGGSGSVCLAPAPNAGRCLDLPKRCPESGPQPPNCLPACEFKPQVGNLTPVVEWHWGPSTVREYKAFVDVWSTPVVGRVTDTNCDGKVDELDPPNVFVVSGDSKATCCHCTGATTSACRNGVLRALDGASGKEIWSLRRASAGSIGFAAVSLALGDVDGDGKTDVVAVTGEGLIVAIDGSGKVTATSTQPVPGVTDSLGWGGGLSVADMDGDGKVEIAFGATLFRHDGQTITRVFANTGGGGGGSNVALSTFADVDGDGKLELVTGNAAYEADGSTLWKSTVGDGFPAIGDFDGDGKPEVVSVKGGNITILAGDTGATLAGPFKLPGTGSGGPPTIADFDGDGQIEIGVAMANYYSVTKVDLAKKEMKVLWQQVNHDFSSSVTGSTVFDFQGDGSAEVIYNDECFLWVYDGKTGAVRFATPTNSFTGTESSLVADIDGDGKAEILMISNGASPQSWRCTEAPWTQPDPVLNRPAWTPPPGETAHRGLTVWGDKANGWVGTRALWNQHTYHVSNICDVRDSACAAGNTTGTIPKQEQSNWKVPWLNNFRQNVQDKGIFDAPDATVSLRVECKSPLVLRATVRNLGLALLPKGVEVGFLVDRGTGQFSQIASAKTTTALFPGQGAELVYTTTPADNVKDTNTFKARILVDPQNPTFNECRDDNNESSPRKSPCAIK
ncbi:MAG: VCBS repeat-containing protein [Myxococcales bacterium]|nr:VCBS repeat-containing protein [Myxococcales bacterium]